MSRSPEVNSPSMPRKKSWWAGHLLRPGRASAARRRLPFSLLFHFEEPLDGASDVGAVDSDDNGRMKGHA